MYTKEEIEKMTPEEKIAAFKLDFAELMCSESKNYDNGLIVVDEVISEKRLYKDGKVITIKKIT